MIGERFGRLVVIRDSGIRRGRAVIYECLCDCGKTTLVRSSHLRSGNVKSCGCLTHESRGLGTPKHRINHNPRPKTKIGLTIHRLTILDVIQEYKKQTLTICKCSCGNIIIRSYKEVIKGNIKSCGCIRREISAKTQEKRDLNKSLRVDNIFKPPKDFTNKRFGKLTILYWCGVNIDKHNNRHSLWYCRCDCGSEVIKKTASFKNPNISCGCTYRDNKVKRAVALATKHKEARYSLINNGGTIDNIYHKNRRLSQTVRSLVYSKYGANCLICGISDTKSSPLCIHHLKPHWRYPKLRYFAINNIPLCRSCHDKLHKKFGFIYLPPISQQIRYVAEQRSMV